MLTLDACIGKDVEKSPNMRVCIGTLRFFSNATLSCYKELDNEVSFYDLSNIGHPKRLVMMKDYQTLHDQ